MSVLSFTVTFSGLTDTMGGSETKTDFDLIDLSKISRQKYRALAFVS
jgi:hypothetical protein